MSKEEIIEAVKAMTVVELSELVKAIEEEFGVSAVAAAAPAEFPIPDKGLEELEQEQQQLKKKHHSMLY